MRRYLLSSNVRFVQEADISRREFSFVSPKLFAPKRVTEASPEYETDRKDESEIAIGSCGRRRRQWRGTREQGKRLGIEYRRAGTLDDPAVQHVTLSIDAEAEINDARGALGRRRIALEARNASDQGLLPAGNRWSRFRRHGDCSRRGRLLELRLGLRGFLGGLLLYRRCGPPQCHHQAVQALGETVDV